MVSAWQVYLVMQLDVFGLAFTLVSVLLMVATIIAIGVAAIMSFADPDACNYDFQKADAIRSARLAPYARRIAKNLIAALLFCTLAATLLPSSKTAAAMIILPAVTSDKVIDSAKGEVKELLGLTKDALRGLNPDNHKPKPSEGK